MDTSKEYLKMCEKAGEIQRVHQWQEGDCFINPSGFLGFYCGQCSSEYGFYEKSVWLPRQDQLQEMIGGDIQYRWDRCNEFWFDITHSVGSFEQLWLAFVMKEKFNKIWNGEEWVIK